MPTLAMVYEFFARDRGATHTIDRVGTSAETAGRKAESSSKQMRHFAEAIGAIALVEAGKKSLQMAGDFQQSTNVLVTAAGETQSNLGKVRQGIMDIAVGTGTPLKALTDGMYQVEKAGYRGADGLAVLKTASQGAREEGANLATVTSAMTSIMQSYHVPVKDNVSVMNQLKTAAGESKTTMEQFAGSLATVLPVASANGISFAKVAGALATLTQHGTSADEATQELSNTIRNLAAPNMVAIKMMGQLGINSQDVSQKLGQRGVAGTVNYLAETVLRKMGPSGKVLLNTFYQSTSAGKAVQQMLGRMDPTVRKLAEGYIKGTITQKQWGKSLVDLTPQQVSLARQFAVLENKSRGFNTAIRQGMPGSVTFSDAIKKMTGGANGLNTTLQLTGESTAGTTERIKRIADAAKGAGKDVSGWASTQKLFNVQLDMFKERVQVLGVRIGTALMPSVLGAAKALGGMLDFVQRNQRWLVPLAKTVLTVAASIYAVNKATAIWAAASTALATVRNRITGVASGLSNFVTRAGTASSGVKTWSSRLGGLASFLGGPWGVAIGIGVTALGMFLGKQKQGLEQTPQFKQDVLDYATAMDQMTGAITRSTTALDANVRAETVKGLQDKGAFDLAQQLGISVKTLTDATLGNKDAIKQVNGVLQHNLNLHGYESKANSDRIKAAGDLSHMINAQALAEIEQIRKENQRKAAMDTSTVASRLATAATRAQGTALKTMTESLRVNGKTLDANTAQGHANRSAIKEAIIAINQKAQADYNSTVKTKGQSAALRVASDDLKHGRTDILNAASAAHANTGQVDGMIRKYQASLPAIASVRRGVQGLAGDLHNVHSKAANLDIRFRMAANKAAVDVFKSMPGSQASGLVGLRPGFGSGGLIPGHSPHPKADNILVNATAREFMQPVSAVDYYGVDGMEAIRQRKIPREALQHLAEGGIVSRLLHPRIIPQMASIPAAATKYALGAAQHAVQGPLSKLLSSLNAQLFSGLINGPMVAKALAAVGESYPIGMCLQFVRTLLGAPGGPPTAIAGWNSARYKHPGDTHPPAGAPVWWGGGLGHVADYVGSGKIVTTDLPTMGRVGLVPFMTPSTRWGKPYLGWTGDIDGKVLQFGSSRTGSAAASGGLQGMAQQLLRLHGWEAQFPALDYIVSHESGWNVHARNASSGAYGLGQALPASKMAPFGGDYMNSANTQLRWMMSYMGSRYGDPNNAAAFWKSHQWYDGGGVASGRGLMPKNTIKPERVLPPHETQVYDELLAVLKAQGGLGARGPLVHVDQVSATVDLDAFARQAEFRARQGSFT